MSTDLENAERALNDAVLNVAQLARELFDTADYQGPNFVVEAEMMFDLRDALKEWANASDNFLATIVEKEPITQPYGVSEKGD
jgi:hypothetical protein